MNRRRTSRRHGRQDYGRSRRHHRAPEPFGIPLGGWLLIVIGTLIIVAQYRHTG